MAICGYNEKIGEGLRILVDGMVEALENKVDHSTVEEVLRREVIELETMIFTMKKAENETLTEMFVGLDILAKALFERVRKNLKDLKSEALGAECRGVGESFIALLSEAEKRSEQRRIINGKEIPPEIFARELAEWVVRQGEAETAVKTTILS